MKKLLFITMLVIGLNSYAQENFNLKLSSSVPKLENASQVNSEIQARLYDLIAHYHSVQQAHWNVRGPQFESLHSLLGDFYGSLGEDIDRLAERKLVLGEAADGRPSAVSSNSSIGRNETGFQKDYDVVNNLVSSSKTLSDNLGGSISKVGEMDVTTQDLLIDIQASVDLYLWKLRSFSY